ncbi:MAG: peptidoglycan DD-metalloendopeptidase family protein [Candidatus Limnocylindrales bacterium]
MPALTFPIRVRSTARLARSGHSAPSTSTHIYPAPHARQRRRLVVPSLAALRGLPVRSLLTRPGTFRLAVGHLGHERIVAIAAAGILLGASVLSVAPGGSSGDTGGPSGDGSAPRLAVGGSGDGDDVGSVEEAYVQPTDHSTDRPVFDGPLGEVDPVAGELLARSPDGRIYAQANAIAAAEVTETQVEGPFLADGTLLKPVAVDTTVADGRALIRTYKVKAGDTLATIADRFDVSTMTLWWANDLRAKDQLVQGQVLNVPPVSGLVVEVEPTDTLASLARTYKLSADEIVSTNGLDDRNLVVGQVLVLPGAKGAPIATPKPKPSTATPTRPRTGGGGSGTAPKPPRSYSGGNFYWPTSSHHVSQYYHYGHYGLDIDGSTGDPIYSAASGTVIFAGWKNNGGGYQVWLAHGSGLYTTYNHMSGVSVGRGQTVGKGQRVGRMGATGYATGSHLHFEVWKGEIWGGGRRVNPLAYL